ncbi:MAG: 50S ribosomal protein L25 [Candidatus Uhrbacteria bacterium GW2011_GWF2_39_13]|uniref:Large ribosomal subunit protein bL25 n=1 Tax=Candidatus Uhrbacteria bacterium GW2011_GWF2_39_13 TaxID=1618995 RepID=A0A0G0MN44_9BACT|nr:MAG: 50S ribosomal protein L25 [Candidatus Uhrbacteria bacterium GW2011_GWF2_39_13]
MSKNILEAKIRSEKGRKTATLRAVGSVPAVVYGVNTKPQMITVDRNQFVKMYQTAGESSIVELKIDQGEVLHVLIQDYQIDPIRSEVSHIDFRSIDMNKEIETEVDLEFVGQAPAVKVLGGTLVTSRESVGIRCLPSHFVRSIAVDLSKLVTFDDVIRVSDLVVSEGIKIMEEPTLSLVVVTPPRSDAELEALNATVEENITSVETVEKKKEESVDEQPSK